MCTIPEFSVSCKYIDGKYCGRRFHLYTEADQYFRDCINCGKYVEVRLYDVVDNLLDDWILED